MLLCRQGNISTKNCFHGNSVIVVTQMRSMQNFFVALWHNLSIYFFPQDFRWQLEQVCTIDTWNWKPFHMKNVVKTIRQQKNMENRQRNSKMWYWTKITRKHKNNSPSNWALVNKLFPIGHERWERFRRPTDGYHMSWTTGKWGSAKTDVTFCSLGTKRKSFLYRFVFENLKRKKSWISPRRTIHINRKTESLWWKINALRLVWPEECGELLKPGNTVNTKRYKQHITDLYCLLLEKRLEYWRRQHKVIFLHKKARSRTAKPIRDTLVAHSRKVLPRATYSPDLAPFDYHLFASMSHAIAEQRCGSYENVKKWFEKWFTANEEDFTDVVFTNCPKEGKMYNKRWNRDLIKHFLSFLLI